jgi:hypothetical protein
MVIIPWSWAESVVVSALWMRKVICSAIIPAVIIHLNMNRSAVVFFFLFSVFCSASAQTAVGARVGGEALWTPEPLWKFDDHSLPKATAPKEMISSLRIDGVTIRLEEETELEAMQTRFGGEIGSQGDAADSLGWLCIYGRDAVGPWVVWLESGEIDGPYIGAFQWRRVSRSARFDERCSALPDTSEVELPIDLDLGISEKRVIKILGHPTSRRDNTLLYEHQDDELIRGEEFFSSNVVIVALRGGVVWAIQVTKTVTN